MPPPEISSPQDPDNVPEVDILDQVSLTFFKAQPTAIGPFGASTLSWAVSGPPAVKVKLNGREVARTGEQIVHPVSTTSFRLSAHFRQASKPLGSVQVSVDRASCETYDLANPRSAMEAAIRAQINNSEDLYFPNLPAPIEPLVVSFSPGRIRIRLELSKRRNNSPDPRVHIDASFGLAVREGALEAVGEQISVSVTVPAWVWLVPTIAFGLAIALAIAEDNAKKDVQEMIDGMAQLLGFLGLPPQGKRLSTVRVDNGNNGAGVVEFTACSSELLVKLADLSGVLVSG